MSFGMRRTWGQCYQGWGPMQRASRAAVSTLVQLLHFMDGRFSILVDHMVEQLDCSHSQSPRSD